jgi:thioredoxin reductase (NADPH)
MTDSIAPVLIVGGGPAGLTASIYAARANLKPIQFLGLQPGGQLMITSDVENFPGFSKPIQGPVLMQEMLAQAHHMGGQLLHEKVQSLDLAQRPFVAHTDGGRTYRGHALILATGAQAKWLGIPGEELFRGFGVSACATCDGFFFRDQTVAVIGGGNTAVEEALYLTRHAKQVIVIHRRDRLNAENIMQKRVREHPSITIRWNTVVEEICGRTEPNPAMTHLRLRAVDTHIRSELEVQGAFVAIGHAPSTQLVEESLEIDSHGYVVTKPNSTCTSIPGVFAAGDVQDRWFRQAITAAGQGCMAAMEADRYLQDLGVLSS